MKILGWAIGAWVLGAASGVGVALLEARNSALSVPLPEAGVVLPHATPAAQPVPEGAQPRVEVVNGERFDFGVMDRGTKRQHAFVFQNTGTAPLELKVGETSCKCTIGEIARDMVPPGESVEVKLEWKAESYAEQFRQNATILTNDPRRPEVLLLVEGKVHQAVRPHPERLTLTDVSAKEPREAQLRVYAYQDDDLQVVDAQFGMEQNADVFEVRSAPLTAEQLAEEPNAKSGVLVTVIVKPGLPVGPFHQLLRLSTSATRAEELELPIEGNIVSDISIVGGSNFESIRSLLSLGVVSRTRGSRYPLHVLVKGPYRDEVQLEVAEIDPEDGLRATVSAPRSVNEGIVRIFPLTVEVPPGSPAVNRLGSEQGRLGRIRIRTNHPEVPELMLYVRFAVEG